MYVDESGDPGIHRHSSPHFILSGLIISQDDWNECLNRLKKFRKEVKAKYGLNQGIEIHASELIRINKTEAYRKIRKSDRISILKDYASQIPKIFETSKLINVCFRTEDFDSAEELQLRAWGRLIQRYDTYLKKVGKDTGIIVSDDTDGKKIIQLLRKMRRYNLVTSHYSINPRNIPTDNILEDLFQRASHESYFIQTVDVVAHLLYRKEFPKGSLRKYGLEKLFDRLEPILLKEAAKNDDLGIVRK